jgi:hypothetical protein
MKIFILMIGMAYSVLTVGQTVNKEYVEGLKKILVSEKSVQKLIHRLDTLNSRYSAYFDNKRGSFDRDIDFGGSHMRLQIVIRYGIGGFQVDLLRTGDTICAKSLKQCKSECSFDPTVSFQYSIIDTQMTRQYLKKRNRFYSYKKKYSDIISDLSRNEVFALHCGIANSMTPEGRIVYNFVDDENVTELFKMLSSFCVEQQAYGVSGFEMLDKRNVFIPEYVRRIIQKIKERNSDTVTCSGCISGVIEKIYTK